MLNNLILCVLLMSVGETIAQSNGDLRLRDGLSIREGRLEIFYSSRWGTICDDYFDMADAHVACRQLGYLTAEAVKDKNYFGNADSGMPIWLDHVDCTGNEATLSACWDHGWGVEDCSHSEDVGVICTNTQPNEGAIRLVDGRDLDEGRIEIYHQGIWGTICNDYWGYDDARVACRQLGYYYVGDSYTSKYGPGTGPIMFESVQCYGYEDYLLQCRRTDWYVHNCVHSEDVGIRCAFNDNGNMPGWAISLIVIGSLFSFVLFAVIIGKLCSKPRSKRNAAAADVVSTNEPAPMQTYPVHVGAAYPPPNAYPPPTGAPTAPYPPTAVAYQAYPPTATVAGTAQPPAYTPVAPAAPAASAAPVAGAEGAYPPSVNITSPPEVK